MPRMTRMDSPPPFLWDLEFLVPGVWMTPIRRSCRMVPAFRVVSVFCGCLRASDVHSRNLSDRADRARTDLLERPTSSTRGLPSSAPGLTSSTRRRASSIGGRLADAS